MCREMVSSGGARAASKPTIIPHSAQDKSQPDTLIYKKERGDDN